MGRSTSVFLGWLLLLSACGRNKEDHWPERAARVSCKTARRCDTVDFYFSYDSLDACVQDTVGTNAPTGCTYDKKAARQCIHDMKWGCKKLGAKYDELQADCAAVWICPEPTTTDTGGLQPL